MALLKAALLAAWWAESWDDVQADEKVGRLVEYWVEEMVDSLGKPLVQTLALKLVQQWELLQGTTRS